jgi:hypothetical protein
MKRFLNLVYYRCVMGMDVQERESFDRMLDMLAITAVEPDDNAPAWWRGDEEASASTLVAAQQLGLRVT